MRSIVFVYIFISIFCVTINSCSKDEEPYVEVKKQLYEVPEDGGDVSIAIKSNTDFNIQILSSWISIAGKGNLQFKGDENVLLIIERNNSGDTRDGIVNIVDNKGKVYSSITIHQALNAYISLNTKQMEFDEYGGEESFIVKSNVPLDISSSDWISVRDSKILDEESSTKNIKVNKMITREGERSGIVRFTNSKFGITDSLIIKQKRPLYINLENYELYIDETIEFPLRNELSKKVYWKSSKPEIVAIYDGIVKGLSQGDAIISVFSEDGIHSDSIHVNTVEITSKLSHTWDASIVNFQWLSAQVTCLLKNNSRYHLELIKCNAYDYGFSGEWMLCNTDDFSSIKLAPEKEIGSELGRMTTGDKMTFKFEWFFIYEGKEYTYSCNYDIKR